MEKEVLFPTKFEWYGIFGSVRKNKNRCEFILVIVLDSLHIKFKRKSISFHATFKTFSWKLQNTIFL